MIRSSLRGEEPGVVGVAGIMGVRGNSGGLTGPLDTSWTIIHVDICMTVLLCTIYVNACMNLHKAIIHVHALTLLLSTTFTYKITT